jgi:CheY-like chemotaxis protein
MGTVAAGRRKAVRDRVTILVVGNLAVRTALRAILESDGRLHVIDEVDDGDQAVEAYRARPTEVIVVCQRSADDDCLETARRIRDEASDARIIVVGSKRVLREDAYPAIPPTRAVTSEAAGCLPGVAVELGRR